MTTAEDFETFNKLIKSVDSVFMNQAKRNK